jgi:site-specific recombinase XerD
MINIPKGKRKKKTCEVYLKAYLMSRTDDLPLLFLNSYGTRALSVRTLQFHLKIYADQLGFPIMPHTLRHTFAAHLAKRGCRWIVFRIYWGHENQKHTKLYARLYSHVQKQTYG